MTEKYGFIYIWRDRKHNRYYVGSHWGTENDGYVCSSRWMRKSHKRRPQDFKRRILAKTTDRKNLLAIEAKWLSKIKKEEVGKRYYNLNTVKIGPGHWSHDEHSRLSIGQKISKVLTGTKHTEEAKRKISENHSKKPTRGTTGMKMSEETKLKISLAQKGRKKSTEQIEKNRSSHIGIKHTDETKKKISANNWQTKQRLLRESGV